MKYGKFNELSPRWESRDLVVTSCNFLSACPNPIIPKKRVQIEKRKPIAKHVKNQSVSVCSFLINQHGVHCSTFSFWSYPLFDRSLKLARSVSRQLLNGEYLSAYVTSKFNSEVNKTPVKMPLTLNTWNFASG